jgi:purine-binding chemotaxis protein CheW
MEALQLLVFRLDEQRYALRLAAAEKVARMVKITPLPKAPEIILGVIDVHGTIVPVADLRKRFSLPARKPAFDDRLIVARIRRGPLALVADRLEGIVACGEEDFAPVETLLPEAGYLEGVVKLRDGLVLIQDLDRLLSLEEAAAVERALESA